MDFRDSPKEAEFRAEARAFLEAHAPEQPVDFFDDQADEDELLERSLQWQSTLFEHGWATVTWPREYGGRGLGPIEQIIWNQELARAGFGETMFVVGIGMAGPTIIAHGSDEQKERFLARMLRGDEIWCQLFSEPGAGSDLASVACRAERDGDHWVVTGQKTWCSGAHYAHWGILLARTNPKAPKNKGITYFLLDMKSPGIEVCPLRQMTGSSHFSEVFLNEVRIPDASRLGAEGEGWAAARTTLMNERMAIGGMERMFSFDELRDLIRARPDRIDDVMRDEAARVYTWVRTLDLLNKRIITKLGKGVIPTAEASVMKLALARLISRGSGLALRTLGADALLRPGYWQNQFLYAPAFHIGGGTDEIQKNIAAERVLGLPREPSTDREVPFDELPRS
jgi:alkylation response protein AidB-like acyl-CoA dehydrogenase